MQRAEGAGVLPRLRHGADELLHPDVVIHAPLGLSTDSAEAEKQVWRDGLSAMPDLRHDVQEVVVDGDVEMARVIVTGTMRAAFADIAALKAQVGETA